MIKFNKYVSSILIAFGFLFASVAYGQATISFTIPVSITASTNSATINWATVNHSTATIDYGSTTNYGSSLYDDSLGREYTATFPNLSPGTTYYYRATITETDGTSLTQAYTGSFTTVGTTPSPVVTPPVVENPTPTPTPTPQPTPTPTPTSTPNPTPEVCNVAWNQIINSRTEHENCSGGPVVADSHFTKTWLTSGSWNGVDGYMRWNVTRTLPEDDDGYWINHPLTSSRPVYISFMVRAGSTWWTSFTRSTKFVMFYNTASANPRPTIFNKPIYNGSNYVYRSFGPDLEAGGHGDDPYVYPNHPYKEGPGGHSEWWFVVMSLEADRTKVYLWNQSGTQSGLYSESAQAFPSLLSSWNASTWSAVRLLAYTYNTTAGDQNAYMDIGRISVTQSLPTPPAEFVLGGSPQVTTPPVIPLPTTFTNNQRVQTTANLNVGATANGTLLGTQSQGQLGTIVGTGLTVSGTNWWNVNYDSGVDGWSTEQFLQNYTAPVTPPVVVTATTTPATTTPVVPPSTTPTPPVSPTPPTSGSGGGATTPTTPATPTTPTTSSGTSGGASSGGSAVAPSTSTTNTGGGAPTQTTTPTTSTVTKPTLTRNLYVGTKGTDVTQLRS